MNKIAIFASGAGSNAQKIINYFQGHTSIQVALIVCNKVAAGVLDIAERENIPYIIIDKEQFFRGDAYVGELQSRDISFIVLAGFLWKIPSRLIEAYPMKIINIHPALLPKYGGKGMYGSFVHEAVKQSGDAETGITIHYVNEHYDQGNTILQVKCSLDSTDTSETIAAKVHLLEHAYFPQTIEKVISTL